MRIKKYILGAGMLIGVLVGVYVSTVGVMASGDTLVTATVPAADPSVTITRPDDGLATRDSTIDVVVRLENVSNVNVYVDGVLVCSAVGVAAVEGLYEFTCTVNIGEFGVGNHVITAVGTRDGDGNVIDVRDSITVRFDPNWLPPNTGALRIGGATVAMRDYVISCVIIVMAAVMFLGFVVLRRKKDREEVEVRVASNRR